MHRYKQIIHLDLRYDVYFTRDLFSLDNTLLTKIIHGSCPKVLTFVDQGFAEHWPDLEERYHDWARKYPDVFNPVAFHYLTGGEAIKNDLRILKRIGDLVRRHELCRHSYIMAFGGGAILDAVGFAASLIHRGIRFIRIPTTVLAQNDSGVGVKNGMNYRGVKNYYGVFIPPNAVCNDLDFLRTLTDRVWISGVAEAFKVGIIKNKPFLDFLMSHTTELKQRDKGIENRMVQQTAQLHLEHIAHSGDPYEEGNSRPLDFGHWSGHKLESMTNFSLLHGEAVAIGIAIDLHYAANIQFIDLLDARAICRAIQHCGLPIYHPFLDQRYDELLSGLSEFRQHLGGALTLAMPKPLGNLTNIHHIDHECLQKSIQQIRILQE